jgi:hypothetical protein
MKTLSTLPTTCAIESKFNSKLSHKLELTAGNSFSKFLSNQAKEFIPFKIYCKFNLPHDKSIKVAEVKDYICFVLCSCKLPILCTMLIFFQL